MEQGTQDVEGRLTQLADFWFFEHLLSMPKSIADDEMVYHLGSMFPCRDTENASLPAPVSARLFLRSLRNLPQPIENWDEQFQMLGLMCQLSCKREQFRSREIAAAIHPPSELIVEVLMQLLCVRADPAYSEEDEQGDLLQPLTSADVAPTAHALLDNADVGYLADDEQLQNRLSLLEQLLRGGLEAVQLQQHLRQAFPADAVEEQLREYADKAWAVLGQTTLQRYQAEVMAGRLPFDPMQHFAALLPVATQAVFGDAEDASAAAAAAGVGDVSMSPLQQQLRARGARPVPLLGEATAPVVGTEDLEGVAAPGSSQGKRAGRGGRQQQAAAAAAAAGASPKLKASPLPKASPQQAKASPVAAAAAGGDDAGKAGRRHRPHHTNKSGKEVAAGGAPTRKQLELQKSTAAAGAAAAAAAAQEDAAAAATEAAAAAQGARKGRKSRKQQLTDEDLISSEPAAAEAAAGDENMPPPAAAAAAGSGGRKRGRKLSPAKGAAAAGAGAAAVGSDEQPWDSSQPNVVDGVEPASGASQEAAAAASGGRSRGLGSAFQSFLNRPLDSLAAAAGGLAAVVRGSPVRTLPKERKLCGAPQEGVKGRTVPWESPFGGSIDSPEESPRGKAAKSPAGAARGAAPAAAAAGGAGRPAVDALKRKRAQADGQKGPLAAARGVAAAAAKAPDSSNTEYQDAREDAGSDSDAAPAARRSPRQQKKPRREVRDESDGDSSIDDPESEKGDESQGDEFEYDAESDEEGGRQQQQQQQERRQGRPSKQQQVGRKPGRPVGAAGRAGGASGGAAARAAGGFDPDFDLLEERGGTKKRRRFQRWTAEEEALLIQLVAAEGEGAWAAILKLGGEGFNRRTQVDLKDKWRNLKKKGAISD